MNELNYFVLEAETWLLSGQGILADGYISIFRH